MIMVNFSRRMLLYPAAERLMGAGTETRGHRGPEVDRRADEGRDEPRHVRRMAQRTGKDLDGVFMKLTMLWTPKNLNPPPVNSMPHLHGREPHGGGSNTFDVPPGQVGEGARVLPAGRRPAARRRRPSARLRRGVRLEDAETGKVLTGSSPTRDTSRQADQDEPEALRRERRWAQAQGQSQVPGRRRVRQSDGREARQGRDGPHGRASSRRTT